MVQKCVFVKFKFNNLKLKFLYNLIVFIPVIEAALNQDYMYSFIKDIMF